MTKEKDFLCKKSGKIRLKIIIVVSVVLLLAICSERMFDGLKETRAREFAPKYQNVEVERVLSKIREYRMIDEEEGIDAIEYDEEMEIGISLKEFLYHYSDIANEKDLPMISASSILDKISDNFLIWDEYPYILVNFNYKENGNHTIRYVSCFDGCTQTYEDAIVKALRLSEFEYGKDYTIEEYYEEGEDGSMYDVFKVIGK